MKNDYVYITDKIADLISDEFIDNLLEIRNKVKEQKNGNFCVKLFLMKMGTN